MNEGDAVDGGGAGEAEPAAGGARVRVCLSERGCRWADDISSGARRQASARDSGVWVAAAAGVTVRQLATEAEDQILASYGLRVATALVLCPARDSALPFYDTTADYVGAEDVLELVGDVERAARGSSSALGGAANEKIAAGGATSAVSASPHKVPIDGDLLAAGDGLSAAEQVVVLDNGCMCCTVRGDLLGAFGSVLAKMEEAKASGGDGGALDSVLVETTGMADPVPIVRTLLQVDLVPSSTAVEVFQRIRSMNASAGVVSCSRGKLDPKELEGLGAFDRLVRETEEEPKMAEEGPHDGHDHSHSHSHSHSHDHDHHDGDGCGGEEGGCTHDGGHHHSGGDEECSFEHDHTGHSHDTRHSSQVGTFSLVKRSTEVLALPFARWVRSLAFLPKDKGVLFRSKAVLAVAGSDRKLIFHAVSDVMERREAGRWADGEDRGCRIVFIGKRLDRAFLEDGFNSTARAFVAAPHPPIAGSSAAAILGMRGGAVESENDGGGRKESMLEGLAARVPEAFFLSMLGLGTGEMLRVGEACSGLMLAVEGGSATEHYRALCEEEDLPTSGGFHLSLRRGSPRFYLHPHVSAATARSYAKAAAGAKLEMTPSMGQGRTGISFETAEQLEAAGITWLEVEQLADPLAKNFVVEFSWREETMATFFESSNSSTSSTMVKIQYEVEDEDAFDEEVDTLKLRLVLRPETDKDRSVSVDTAAAAPGPSAAPPATSGEGDAPTGLGAGGAGSALPLHRLMIQTVGGRSCNQVYGLSFHSISPSFQVHVQVPDHRMQYFQTDQLFHRWHPLMESLRAEPRLRFLVRMKPDGSGPLDNMCGCC
eukprot:g2066.t1